MVEKLTISVPFNGDELYEIIKLSIEEHQSLTRLLSHPKTMKYRSDLYDTETFDTMEDKVYDAVNNLTVEDF